MAASVLLLPAIPLFAALLALGGSPQRAPTPDELRLFDEGTHALAAGDARAAEKAWRAGYEIGHDPAFLVHIGEAEEKAGAPAEAAESYRRYLREAPDASDRADIESGSRGSSRGAAAPRARRGGGDPRRVRRRASAEPDAGHRPPPPAATTPAAASPARPRCDAEQPAGKNDQDSGWNRNNATAVIASGVTLALLGTAAFYGAEASSKENDINRLVIFRSPPPAYSSVASQYMSAMADGRSDAHTARVLLVVAAGTGIVAALFFVLDALHAPAESAPAGRRRPRSRSLRRRQRASAPWEPGRGDFEVPRSPPAPWLSGRSARPWAGAAAAGRGLSACFNPAQPGCAFSCASDGLCPSGYSCGGDLLCHRDDGQGSCAIPVDAAGTDVKSDGTTDGTTDAKTDAPTGQ